MRVCTALVALGIWSVLVGVRGGGADVPAGAGSAAGPPVSAQAALARAPASYRIASGDTLAVVTLGEDRFSQDCQVNSAGTILLPVVGDVTTLGLTCAELQKELQRKLARYLVDPQVSVTVKQYSPLGASVFVLGEVVKPGMYELPAGATLMQALAAAGGPTPNADDRVTVARAATGQFRTIGIGAAVLALAPDDVLGPGDVVLVKRNPEADQPGRYSVLGEVPTPGMFDLPLKSTVKVLDAMQKAGLLDPTPASGDRPRRNPVEELSRTADLEHAVLARGDVVTPLDLRALLHGDASQNLALQANDVLTVPRRNVISVYAMGEIRTPGKQVLPVGGTVLDLLGAADGVTSGARLSKATLIRLVDGKPTTQPVDVGRLLSRSDATQNLGLQEGDVLFVPGKEQGESGLMRWLPFLPYWARVAGF